MRRTVTLLSALPLLVASVAACSSGEDAAPKVGSSAAPSPAISAGYTAGTFSADTTSTAITYDTATVPVGASAEVTISGTGSGTVVKLKVSGLVPSRAYGAHLHTKPCGATATEAGPHYQHSADPAAAASPPSVDPAYANPRNEIWLDLTTDAACTASATSSQDWTFDSATGPRSLIIHAETTKTAPGVAGKAGDRLACLTLQG